MIPRYLLQPSQSPLARHGRAIRVAILGFAGLILFGVCATSRPPENALLPFAVGEKLTYEMRIAKGGNDDNCRLPARIESTMPVVGTAILSIDSQNTRCKKR